MVSKTAFGPGEKTETAKGKEQNFNFLKRRMGVIYIVTYILTILKSTVPCVAVQC